MMSRRRLLIEGLDKSITKEQVEIHFQSRKKSGGGDIRFVELNKTKPGEAVVEFEDDAVLDRVLQKSQTLNGCKLTVSVAALDPAGDDDSFPEAECCTVQVSGLSSKTTEDSLMCYFENTRRSGGGDVQEVQKTGSTAWVKFISSDVAKRVVQHLEHKLDGVSLKVVFSDLVNNDSCEGRILEVTCLASVTTQDALFNYFENTKRSGGGDVESVEMKPELNMAIVTFKNAQDAHAVIAKGKHTIDKTEVTVSLKPPVKEMPSDPCRLYVTGISDKTTEDGLMSFMEVASGLEVSNVDFGTHNNAIITFDGTPDLQKVLARCCKRALDGSFLIAENLPVCSCLLVTGLNPKTSEDSVCLHFENPRRGGGDVDKVELKAEEGWALVFFKNPEDAEKAAKKEHNLDSKQLTVTPHQPLLAKTVTCTVIREQNVEIDPDVMSFLYKIKAKELAELEKQCQLKMNWENGSGFFTCVPTSEMTQKYQWETSCQMFTTFVSKHSKVTVTVLPEIWQVFQGRSQEIIRSRSDNANVDIVLCSENSQVVIIGENQDVDNIRRQLEDMKTEIEQEAELKASRITDELTDIPKNKLLLLDNSGFQEELQKKLKQLEMRIAPEEQTIYIEGPQAVVHSANSTVWKTVSKIVEKTVSLPHRYLDLLKAEPGRLFTMKKFEENRVKAIVVFEDDGEENEALVLGMNQQDFKRAVDLLQKAMTETNIALTEEHVQLTKSQKWCQLKDELIDGKVATISVDENSLTLLLVSLTDDIQAIGTTIESFFAENTIVTKVLPLPEGSRRFLFKHMKDKVDTIQQKVQNQSVQIKERKEDGKGILVSGTAEGVSVAQKKLQEVIASIKEKAVKIDKPGMSKFFTEGKGVKLLSIVENEHKCTIDRHCPPQPSSAASTTSQPPTVKECECSYTTPEGKKISVFKDDLTKHHAEVIVNAADSKLQHAGGLAKAIVDAGGKEIQDECDKFVIDNGPLLEGHVAVTTGGNLPYKIIVHAVGPRDYAGPGKSRAKKEKLLRFAVMNALEEAAPFKSVAIPAISTGAFGFPRDLCAKILVDVVLEFSKKNPHCSLSEVHLTDTDDASIREIVKVMTARFKDDPTFCDSSKRKTKEGPKTKGRRKGREVPAASHHADTVVETPHLHADPNTIITPEGIRITLKTGDLSKEQADIIVNTASSDLDLSKNACAKTLSAVAGASLQQECSTKGKVDEGNMAVTGGGNLKCTHVFHVVCGSWNGGAGEQVLRKIIQKCLQETEARNLATIAIPAIGTGNLAFPRDRVAIISLEETSLFSQKNPTSSLKEVRLVVYDKDQKTVQAFQDEFLKRQPKRQPPNKKRRGRAREVETTFAGPSDEFDEVAEEEMEAARELDPNKPEVVIGSIVVQVQAGDITKEATDAIVTVSNRDLDVAQGGGVGAAILGAGGQSIQTECFALLKDAVPGGVVCTGAGNLKTKRIYHMIPSSLDETSLKTCIIGCLRKADSDGVTSISFPAVGTGNYGVKPKSAAKMLLAAVESFSDEQPRCLTSVRIVVFQGHMLRDYHHVISDGLASKSRGGGLFSKVTSYIGGWFGYGRETGRSGSPITKASNPSKDLICLTIYGSSNSDITGAEKNIHDLVAENYKQKTIENDVVSKLSPNEKRQILRLQRQYGTRIEVEEAIGRIVISGNPDDVLTVASEIYEVLNKNMAKEHNRGYAELLSERVQWYFIDGHQPEPYDKDINAQIEGAYKNGDKSVIINYEENERYEIVFKDSTETKLDTGEKAKVVRKEIGKGIDLPDNWVPQPDDGTGKEKEVHLVALDPTTDAAEFQKIVDEVKKTTTLNITKIERVQNPTLFKAYTVKKMRMDEKNGSNEKQLFHGTSGDSCTKINANGFNRSFCGKNATCYGNGVYFARDASYSTQTTYSPPDGNGNRFLYLARVLVGDYAVGRQGLITPPPKASVSTDAYDTVVNNTSNPVIFVVFYDNQCYPDYLITFK